MPIVTIVTVTHHSSAVIGRMLASVDVPEAPVIVVDNGSVDDTSTVAASFPNVQVIHSRNIGYGCGANLGFRDASTPYVLLVNPDAVFTHGAISQMLAAMETHPELGMLGARMFSVVQGQKEYDRDYAFDGEGLAATEWIVGALMLIRRDALEKIGMFDEEIFLFYEETDLCKRFIKAGYKIAVTADAEVEHEAGSSSPPSVRVVKIKAWHSAWSKAYYYRKHFSYGMYLKKCLSKLLTNSLRCVRAIASGNHPMLVKNCYEFLGVLGYMCGMKSFKNGVGRFT